MKILILTGRFGMGHVSAAKALQQEFETETGAQTKIIDIVEHMLPNMHKGIYNSFNKIADKYPTIYNRAYTTSESNIDLSFSRFFLKKFDRLLDNEQPDMIVCTLHLASKLVSNYKQKTGSTIPLITCITDISSSAEWINERTDYYLVATEGVKEELNKKGINQRSIVVSGIPVRQAFKTQTTCAKQDDNHVLMMGGGLGLLPKSMAFYERLNRIANTKTTIITGGNKEMYDLLFNQFENIQVIGYSNEVHKHMQKADVIVSKAGGITLFETIHSELPIIVPCPFLAQEISNAEYIEHKGIGQVVWNETDDLAAAIEDVISNTAKLKKMKHNARRLKQSLSFSPTDLLADFAGDRRAAL